MKIKNQFKLFIAGIIIVPTICMISLPIYHWLTSPERLLLHDYKQLRKMSELPLTERDWDTIKDILHTVPPEVEFIVVANHSDILLATIPEYKNKKQIDDHDLFEYIKSTSRTYFYQVVSPPLEDTSADILFISRVSRDRDKIRSGGPRFALYMIIFIATLELFSIIVIAHISTTISHSITLLEKNTQRIAGGELDVELEAPKNMRSNNEITSLTESLDKMRRSLKDEQERRTRFIMGISHDLRTPVAVIKGYTEALSDGVVSDPAQMNQSLEIIGSKTNQLETMIDTLINFVKLDSKDWRQQLVSQKLEPVLSEFAESCQVTGPVFKRRVSTSVSVSKELSIPFDKQLLQRALENLFSNAIRYSKENDSITISAAQTESAVTITVADTGCGIDEKDIGHIFDLFYRGTNSRRESGMGIGLSVVKNIVDTHGWTIRVESEKGKGSSFIITIPVTGTVA
jgi:signal transduction histidine kinase